MELNKTFIQHQQVQHALNLTYFSQLYLVLLYFFFLAHNFCFIFCFLCSHSLWGKAAASVEVGSLLHIQMKAGWKPARELIYFQLVGQIWPVGSILSTPVLVPTLTAGNSSMKWKHEPTCICSTSQLPSFTYLSPRVRT